MESYLIRIYRKAENDPNMLVGVVREIGTEEQKAFNSLYQLWDILNAGKKEAIPEKRGSSRTRNSNGNTS